MSEFCENCRYFIANAGDDNTGLCRRNPPTAIASQWVTTAEGAGPTITAPGKQRPAVIVNTVMQTAASFPGVAGSMWCGEWAEKAPSVH